MQCRKSKSQSDFNGISGIFVSHPIPKHFTLSSSDGHCAKIEFRSTGIDWSHAFPIQTFNDSANLPRHCIINIGLHHIQLSYVTVTMLP